MKNVDEPKDPDQNNIYHIGKHFLTEEEKQSRREKFLAGGYSYKEAKEYVFEKIWSYLQPLQKNYFAITDAEIIDLLDKNAKIVGEIATEKIKDVYKKI